MVQLTATQSDRTHPAQASSGKKKNVKEVPIFVSSSHGLRGEAVSLGERGRKKGGKARSPDAVRSGCRAAS